MDQRSIVSNASFSSITSTTGPTRPNTANVTKIIEKDICFTASNQEMARVKNELERLKRAVLNLEANLKTKKDCLVALAGTNNAPPAVDEARCARLKAELELIRAKLHYQQALYQARKSAQKDYFGRGFLQGLFQGNHQSAKSKHAECGCMIEAASELLVSLDAKRGISEIPFRANKFPSSVLGEGKDKGSTLGKLGADLARLKNETRKEIAVLQAARNGASQLRFGH